jgi:hypothetical protein
MSKVLIDQVTEELQLLPDDAQYHVLAFVLSLRKEQMHGTPGERLLKYAGILSANEAETMMQTIEHDCRRIDLNEW